MMVINNNIPALNAYDVVNNTSNQLQKSIQKLSTGLRINSAADDAAGLSISEKMRAQISGLDQAVSNTQDGISLIQTAEGALTETHSILQRMRELSVQAANDTYTAQDRSYIQEEMNLLRDEIDHIGNTTTFNTKKLLNGDSAVLWSSDNLNTKALVRGGLRNIDQFGQKSSSEGNYKITVAAEAGTGEVQKSDILKIKHDLDPYVVEGTNSFDGAVLDGSADFEAVGARTITVTLGDAADTGATAQVSYTIRLNHDVKDNAGLAEALNVAITGQAVGGSPVTATTGASVTKLGDIVTINRGTGTITDANYDFVATTSDGQLVINSSKGNSISIVDGDGSNSVNSLTDVLGASTNSDTLYSQNSSVTLGNFTANATANYGLTLRVGAETATRTIDAVTTAAAAAGGTYSISNAVSDLQGALDTAYGEGNVVVSSDGTKLTLTSKIGTIRAVSGGANLGAGTGAFTYGTSQYVNQESSSIATGGATGTATLATKSIDSNAQEFDFSHAVSNAKITVTLTDPSDNTAVKTDSLDLSTYTASTIDDTDSLVAALNSLIDSSQDLAGHVSARKVTDDNGNEKVRLYSEWNIAVTDASAADITQTVGGDEGSASAIFGTAMTTTTGTSGTIASGTTSANYTLGAAEMEDMLSLSDGTTYSFKILDSDNEELTTITITGPFEPDYDDDGAVTKTASEKVVDAINTKLAADKNLSDFKAVYDSKTGKVSIASGVRDFSLKDDTSDPSYKGYADLLGNSSSNTTVGEADPNSTMDNPVGSIGVVAKGETVLRDIDKFWDSQGNFLLEDPQTITITQGDGQQAKVTLYKYDTVDDMVSKFNNAIAQDLGQAKYLDETDKNYKDALNSFVTFVENAEDDGQESVQGTMLIRTVAPGSTGTLNFASNNEDLINALSLNTIQKADDSKYHVTIQDAHSGVIVNNIEDEKITNNVLVGRLHQNVDVEFNGMTGITATWDDKAKEFVLKGAYDETGDMTNGEVTYLHLTDNTTVFQIGANEGDDMGINIGDMRSHALGLDKVLVTDHNSASRSISIIDAAIDKVSTQRAKLGAYQNRLEHTASNLTTSSENLTAAESRIRDTDMAKEMMNFTKLQIMLQAGNSMLSQANQLPQNVLSLIR